MYRVIENKFLTDDMYLLKVEGNFKGEMGQFYMLRAWENYPLLSRPISICDIDEKSITFLYKVFGQGTELIAKLKENDTIKLEGPYGNGFKKVEGKVALVGGGIGVAPLYLVAKNIKNCDAYLGFRNEAVLVEEFKEVCDEVIVATNNKFVTENLDVTKYDYILTCGPTPMMKHVVDMADGTDTKIMVSLENHMACGVGACLVCTCKTVDGNKKTCKDGPVFWGDEVVF